jgi:uncharacterized membrane protein
MSGKIHRPGHSSGGQHGVERSRPAATVTGEPIPPEAHFPSEHRAGIVPEKYFRWRAGEITRLEAFCDVVFGFALTLLVVSLEVPRNYGELMAVMRGFVPFAVCFTQLVMIWREHYRFSRRYGLEDEYTIALNMLLLFVVLFYVYPLKFVFTLLFEEIIGASGITNFAWHEASVLMRIYAIGFMAVFAIFALMYERAYRLRGQLELNLLEAHETRAAVQRNIILAAIGLTSLLVAFKSPQWAGWIYCAIGPAFAIHGTIIGKRMRLLAEQG